MTAPILVVEDVYTSYGPSPRCSSASRSMSRMVSACRLLGRNGVGKTTT
jgi:ABC-type branched-subunit amino acid transport system ATPase component